ncbi:MAG TPA: hypothetical protein PLZ78_08945 [Spirochaetota bacterium]|nr:hypothetical protein [Spirochaetota bacterium]
MAQFIMPPTGGGLTMDPYAAARARNDALMGTTQNIGTSLGTLLQAVEKQRADSYNKRFLDSVLGGGDVKTALAAAQGEAPKTGLMGIMNAFNPNIAPSTVPDMQKTAGELMLKASMKTPKEALELEKLKAEIAKLNAEATKKQAEENIMSGKATDRQTADFYRSQGKQTPKDKFKEFVSKEKYKQGITKPKEDKPDFTVKDALSIVSDVDKRNYMQKTDPELLKYLVRVVNDARVKNSRPKIGQTIATNNGRFKVIGYYEDGEPNVVPVP